MSKIAPNITHLIGKTPLLKIPSLSELTGCEILLKCENTNPGRSIKDRAALQLVLDAIEQKKLKPGMTIVEGTGGNTGIGLAVVGRALGYKVIACMPSNQTKEKQEAIKLHGAELRLCKPSPFKNKEENYYWVAKNIADSDPSKYWWANQFENTSNARVHELTTAPEIFDQTDGKLDYFITASGTGGTIGGCAPYLKKKIPGLKVVLADVMDSALANYLTTGELKTMASGSITEGIGLGRISANFRKAIPYIDEAYYIKDQDIYSIAKYVRDTDGICLGTSGAVNVLCALQIALQNGPGKRILTFMCDNGNRSASKLYNDEFLKSRNVDPNGEPIESLMKRLKTVQVQKVLKSVQEQALKELNAQ